MNRTCLRSWIFVCVCTCPLVATVADEPVFSGPQVGEKLAPFKVRGVYDDAEGKAFDYIAEAQGKPLILVFVHKLTRPSHAVIRALMQFGTQREKDGLFTAAVYLYDDMTAGAKRLKPVQRYLPKDVRVGISEDGVEGPGAYGLNRNMTLTVLIARENKVTANFALVQPSVQADVPKILKETVKLIGGQVPTLAQLGVERYSANKNKRKRAAAQKKSRGPALPPEVRALVEALMQKSATADDVDKTAKKLEELFKKKPAVARQVAQTAQRYIDSGRIRTQGSAKAREYLKKWAAQFAVKNDGQKTPNRRESKDQRQDKSKKSNARKKEEKTTA